MTSYQAGGLGDDSLRILIEHGVAVETTDYVRAMMSQALKEAPDTVLSAFVRINRQSGMTSRPFSARANINVRGRLLCIQIAGTTAREATDLLAERTQRRLQRIAEHWDENSVRLPERV